MDQLANWITWILFIFYPVIEGIREYYYYGVNRSANFSQRSKDSDRKTMNVITWALCHAIPVLLISTGAWITALLAFISLAFWRWIALDGVLNLRRGLGFWYDGGSGRSFTDKILYPLPVWQRAALKLLPLIILISLIILL